MEGYVIVIGSARVEAAGRSFSAKLRDGEPNPGRVSLSAGGAGRNIALNLRLLDVPVRLVTVFGGDSWADKLRGEFSSAMVDTSLSLTASEEFTPANISIFDSDRDLDFSISDTELFSRLTPEYLDSISAEINSARAVVFDADLPQESIHRLVSFCDVPLIADPLSALKAEKLSDVLSRLFAIKPNIYEAETLTGICIESDYRLKKAAEAFINAGVKNVFISLGKDGIFAKQGDFEALAPCVAEHVKNPAGGGDAVLAALVWAYLQGLDIREAAEVSQMAARMAVEYLGAVNSALSPEALKEKM